MIRVVLAAVLAVALLGAATPAVEDAGRTATDRELGSALERVASVAETLETRHDAVRPGAGPATRTAVIVVPGDGWGRESATVVVGSGPEDRALEWRIGDGPRRTVRVGVELRVWRDGEPTGGELRLGPGRHRLELALVRVDGRPAVAVRSVRGFKSENGRTPFRVRARFRGDGRGSVRV